MTETEWLQANDYHAMLIYLRGDQIMPSDRTGLHCGAGYLASGEPEQVSKRKLRRFAAALCRKWWEYPLDEFSQAFLRTYERFANDQATWEQVCRAGVELQDIVHRRESTWISHMALMWTDTPLGVAHLGGALGWTIAGHVAKDSIEVTCKDVTEEDRSWWGFSGIPDPVWLLTHDEIQSAYPLLLRELVGNPFRRSFIGTAILSWKDATIVKLAQAIHDDCAFDRMPILADALEESGCDNVDILNHCRDPGEHVRGCWVVDLILGKE